MKPHPRSTNSALRADVQIPTQNRNRLGHPWSLRASTTLKRRLASSRTKESALKVNRKITRGSRLTAAAEGVFHEPTIPRIQIESATSTAAPGTEHPQGATSSRKIPVGTGQAVSCTPKDRSSTCRKQLRLSETSLQGKGGRRSRCGSSVSPTAELGISSAAPMTPGRSPRVTRFPEGERSKALEGKESGQMDVSGCKETTPANFPATQPQGQADPATQSAHSLPV